MSVVHVHRRTEIERTVLLQTSLMPNLHLSHGWWETTRSWPRGGVVVELMVPISHISRMRVPPIYKIRNETYAYRLNIPHAERLT